MYDNKALIAHYNKFNEDKRLESAYGKVEYLTTMRYIQGELQEMSDHVSDISILDIGAGTGRYCIPLAEEGYDVSAVEYVKYNLGILKQKQSSVKAYQGDARKLKRFADESFDLTLLFGPMYHLYTFADKVQALSEAKRVTKRGGVIMVAYLMNEYAVITHGIKDGKLLESIRDGKLDENFHCKSEPEDLYDYVRLEDIAALNEACGLTRKKIISADGPADYLRKELGAMSEESFDAFMEYHYATCERAELLGACAHTVDILQRA